MKWVLSKAKKEFLGKLVWGLHADFERERPKPNKEMFRLWEELTHEEMERFCMIGESMYTYFVNSEGNERLMEEFRKLTLEYEKLRLDYQKKWKEIGGVV